MDSAVPDVSIIVPAFQAAATIEQCARLDFVDTCACCFRRSDLTRLGGFDPRLRVCEDQELSFRMTDAGVRIDFAPDARTYHLHCDRVWPYVRKKFRIARWKPQVLRRHPCKAVRDSHTPQSLKLETAASCAICLAAGLITFGHWRVPCWQPLAAALSAYFMLIAPFVARAARCDLPVALAAPSLLFIRDLALWAGLVFGLFETLLPRQVQERT